MRNSSWQKFQFAFKCIWFISNFNVPLKKKTACNGPSRVLWVTMVFYLTADCWVLSVPCKLFVTLKHRMRFTGRGALRLRGGRALLDICMPTAKKSKPAARGYSSELIKKKEKKTNKIKNNWFLNWKTQLECNLLNAFVAGILKSVTKNFPIHLEKLKQIQ